MSERHRRWLWNGCVPLVLLLAALMPRVVAYGALGNPDEVGWIEQSVAFYDALERGDWAATFQDFHPGVVPMWGFGAMLCARYGITQLRDWQAAGALPMAELARTALWFPVLVSVLTVLAVYGLVRPLAGPWAAFYAAILLAVEPYYLAYTHGIHLDLTQASLMVVAALLWLNYLHRPQRWPYLVGSGIVSGLALITRMQSLYLIPVSLLGMGFYFLANHMTGKGLGLHPGWRRDLGRMALAWLTWLGILVATVFALWPALWVRPGFVIGQLVNRIIINVENPHRWPVFFLGEVITEDPGVLYYALVLLFRLRPLTLILTLLNPLLLGLAWRRLSPRERAAWGLGLGYAVFFFAQMSLGAHKLERYLLPVFPALAILAGVGLTAAMRWLGGLIGRRQAGSMPAILRLLVAVAIVLLALPWLRLSPYFDTYFNPLVGGGPRAAELFTVGSGGGLGMAAAYLNDKPAAKDLYALSFYPDVFRYYFKGHTQSPGWGSWGGLPVAAQYVVVTLGQVQRNLYETTLDVFLPRQPEYTVHINDLDYAWVYRVPRQELGVAPRIQQPLDANFEHQVHLVGYDVEQTADTVRLALYWQLIVSMYQELQVGIQLADDVGRAVVAQKDPPWSGDATVLSWPDGLAVRAEHTLHLPAGLPPGDYYLVVSLAERDEAGHERLLKLEDGGGNEVILGPVALGPP